MSAALKLNSIPNIKLVVQKGPHSGQRFSFSKTKITIGRAPENDIILVNDPLISRQHAYIQINNNDVEIINLSTKNPILVNNENVNKWKLINGTVVLIGDTEFLIQIENQQSIIVVKSEQNLKVIPQNHVVNRQEITKKTDLKLTTTQPRRMTNPQFNSTAKVPIQNIYQTTTVASTSDRNKKIRFYIVIGIVLAIGLFFGLNDSSEQTKKNKKSTLKYSDEIAIKLNSHETAEAFKKQENVAKLRQSSNYLRAEENFSKGMRAFQQGSYSDSIEYFQQTLTNNPEHILAKRYLFLSKSRFDEILKAKIELGQGYFESNNFKLCASLFKQVIEMLDPKQVLQGSANNTNLLLAQTMLKKCEFAAEGIH